MKRNLILIVFFCLVATLAGIRYFPVQAETYRNIAHYAVSVRKFSSCEEKRSFFDEQTANAAYWFIAWNNSGYENYRASGRQLLHFTLGKLKCSHEKPRFNVESARAIRAMQLALRRGESLEKLNANGNPPLHMAVYTGNHNVVEFLLENGASLATRSQDGKTASQVLTYLVEAGIGYDATHIRPLLRE